MGFHDSRSSACDQPVYFGYTMMTTITRTEKEQQETRLMLLLLVRTVIACRQSIRKGGTEGGAGAFTFAPYCSSSLSLSLLIASLSIGLGLLLAIQRKKESFMCLIQSVQKVLSCLSCPGSWETWTKKQRRRLRFCFLSLAANQSTAAFFQF